MKKFGHLCRCFRRHRKKHKKQLVRKKGIGKPGAESQAKVTMRRCAKWVKIHQYLNWN